MSSKKISFISGLQDCFSAAKSSYHELMSFVRRNCHLKKLNHLPGHFVVLIFGLRLISYETHTNLKCLNIGTPKTVNFPFVPNGKFMILGVPIFEHIIIRLPFVPNGKFMILGVPIFEHIIIRLPFVPNGKFMILGVPIFEHIIIRL